MKHTLYSKFLLLIILGLGLALAACTQPQRDQAPAPVTPVKTVVDLPRDGHEKFTISAQESLLLVKVMRSGPLSRFGHNHIVGGPVIHGYVLVAPELPDSKLALSVRLADMIVDARQWRDAAGEDFASVPDQQDIEGTRKNMLGPKVLDVEQHPEVTVSITGILGAAPDFSVLARITLKGVTKSLPVPVHIERVGGKITASGTFSLVQSDFDIEPFSILLGAISVEDELQISYSIVAESGP